MSTSVWKYEIEVTDEFVRIMPEHARVIYVAVQDEIPFMWAQVSPGNEPTERIFYVHGTGHPVPDGRVPLGSFMLAHGAFVGHLFEPEDFVRWTSDESAP